MGQVDRIRLEENCLRTYRFESLKSNDTRLSADILNLAGNYQICFLMLALSDQHEGRPIEAMTALARMNARVPDELFFENVNSAMTLGGRYSAYTFHEEAIRIYRAAIAKFPETSPPHGGLGWELYLTGDFEGCVKESEIAVRLNPDATYARYNIGLAYLRLGRMEEARNVYAETTLLQRSRNESYDQSAIYDLKELIRSNIATQNARTILRIYFNLSDEEIGK
jgi:tetratricopeptide (TPR) repeat protein